LPQIWGAVFPRAGNRGLDSGEGFPGDFIFLTKIFGKMFGGFGKM
jgi:hypothetical protein